MPCPGFKVSDMANRWSVGIDVRTKTNSVFKRASS